MSGDGSDRPAHWPAEVDPLTWDDTGKLGVHQRTHQLYWDGDPLVTERRFSTFERGLAVAALILTFVGVAATVVQAYAALMSIPLPPA